MNQILESFPRWGRYSEFKYFVIINLPQNLQYQTFSAIQSFFMAMALRPEVQKKAQEELDKVIGNRLPEFNDRQNLPYISAMVKESLRWQPVVPLGMSSIYRLVLALIDPAVPHMATEADEYNGYYIPKGTIIIGNSWWARLYCLVYSFIQAPPGQSCTIQVLMIIRLSTTLAASSKMGPLILQCGIPRLRHLGMEEEFAQGGS